MILRLFFILAFCFGSSHLWGQIDDITFRRVSPPGGYSFQAVRSFDQDKFGYIWMGSFDGIIRYNSREIVRYTYNPEEKNGLPSNIITSLVIDKHNNIWVSTDKGLCLFNHKTQQFERFHYNYENGDFANNNLFSIELDENDRLWISDEQFFGYLDKEKKQLIRIKDGFGKLPRLLYHDESNRLWLGTEDGSVYRINALEKVAVKIIDGPGSLVRTICINNNDIWVGFEGHGARLFDLEGNLKRHITYSSNPEFDIETASIRKIIRDTRGQIWFGTYHGLFLSIGAQVNHFIHDEYDGLPHNSIYDLFEDEQGGIWIGTWSGGVAYLHHADNKFNNFSHSKEPASISDDMISSFIQTPDGKLYIGTEQGGLNEFTAETTSFKKIEGLEKEGVLNIKDLHVDANEGFWVACAFKGIYYRPKGHLNFIHYEMGEEDGQHLSEKGVYALCESETGMWIGTNFGGINFYDFDTKQISFKSKEHPFSLINDINIRSLLLDSKDNLWAATERGIHKIHLPTSKSTYFNTASGEDYKTKTQSFYFITELSDGNIWIGSGGDGINIYHPKNSELSFFNADGLIKGKDVYGIVEDEDNLWITSNDGLILYNIRDESSRRFVITDGIQGNQFNPNAIFKDRDGNLYFGGTNGFSQLEPKEIKINNRAPNVLINNITVNNRKITPSQIGINKFDPLVLGPKETTLSFNFSSDNYLLPEKNRFKYRLTNFVDQWVEDGNNGLANIVNIPSGDYVFEVLACNNDGVWNDTPARLPIEIKQFWYKSKTAIVSYFLILFIFIIFVFRFILERSKLKKALLIEKIKNENEEQLYKMKLRFFTNISHEFRTPLTLIDWPIKNLLKSENLTKEQHGQLTTIKRNKNRLLQLINQIMDLRKLEKGLSKLNISSIDLTDFVNDRILNFSEEAKSKNISFAFNAETKGYTIEADAEKLDKIIYNLLSNAFKFTPSNGSITVKLREGKFKSSIYYSNQLSFGKLDEEDVFEMTVIDDGAGIESDDLPNIFDRYEQGKQEKVRANSTGIGLSLVKHFTLMHRGEIIAQTTPGMGSRFSVRLPAKQKAQKILYESHEKVKDIDSWETTEITDPKPALDKEEIKILVVENNKELRSYIIKFLQGYYTVLSAENGKEGLAILKIHNVHMVISDVMMPIMDGFELCQTIKSQIETSHIPVILLTALSSAENTSTGLEKGADAYISKPFDENVLLSQIKNLLQQRKRLQESYVQRYMSKQPIDIGSLDNYFLNKVNSIIEENFENENFSVDFLAREMGFSRSQLHRKLKQILNHSCSEYICIVKIKKATNLLATKNYNIDEVAFKSGFNSQSYFNKCFKKIHDQTPKEFLKGLS